jgi:hypothetical protein
VNVREPRHVTTPARRYSDASTVAVEFRKEQLPLPERRVRRKEAARYLTDAWGIPMSPKTLAKLAVIGGGPLFRKAGRIPLYEILELDRYARGKLSPLVGSTSELDDRNPQN